MLCNKFRWLIHSGKQKLMLCLLNGLVKKQNQCRKNGYTTDNTNDNALCHNNTKVKTQSVAHEAQGNEAGHCGDGASDNGGEGLIDGDCHGFLLILVGGLFLIVAVPEENGVVHGDG